MFQRRGNFKWKYDKKKKNINYNIEMKSKNEARKFLPEMLAQADLKISYQKENPKKPGSAAHARYEKYKKANTLKRAMELGAFRGDLIFDGDRGYMKVVEEARAPKKAIKLARNTRVDRARTPPGRRPTTPRSRTPVREGVPQRTRIPALESASMNINRLALATSGAVQQDAVSTLSALNSIFTQPL